jgi:hypothetical protein
VWWKESRIEINIDTELLPGQWEERKTIVNFTSIPMVIAASDFYGHIAPFQGLDDVWQDRPGHQPGPACYAPSALKARDDKARANGPGQSIRVM